MEGKPLPPAGWYSDPEQPQTQRYWNGEQWTDQRAPMAPKQEDKGAGVLVVVSYLAALFIPIIGFILGIVLLVRRQTGHGLAVVLISVAVGIAACALFLEDTEEELERPGEDIEREFRQDEREFEAYDECLRENDFRLRACRDLDPLGAN